MFPPKRKKLRQETQEEINYIYAHCPQEVAIKMLNDEEEFDLPSVDKLEKNIEETFKYIEGKPLELYKTFLKLTDKFNDLYKKYSPCKKGCSGCCKIAVQVSEMEKNIIKKYLEEKNELNKYIYIKIPQEPIIQDGIVGGNYTSTDCPFLENNECKIYPVRPYKCRRYISIDDDCVSKFEKLPNKEIIHTVIHIYSEIYYEKIIMYYCYKKNIMYTLNDIRDIFEPITFFV